MKSRKIFRIAAISAATIGGLLFTQCTGSSSEAEAQVVSVSDPANKTYPVKVQEIAPQVIARTIDYTANLAPWEEVYLATAQPGQIEKIYVEVGDRVNVGDKIADLDPTQLLTARIQLNDAKRNLDRLDTLLLVGGISKQQYDQVRMQYDITKTNVEFLEDNIYLTSPVAGIITGKYYEDEEMYSGAPNTQAGKAAIVTIQQINPLKAVVGLSEKFFPLVYKGMKAEVTCDTYPGKTFEGTVSLIHPTINTMTRTFMVEVTVPNDKEILRAGMFSRVNFALGQEEAMVLPAISILQQEGTNERYIYINRDNVAHRINVKLGKRFDDKIEVISDELKQGDMLVVAGQKNILDGYKLEVVEQ